MNRLEVNLQQSILILAQQGKSRREVARELGIDRATVRRYLGAQANAAISTSGSEAGAAPSNAAISTLGKKRGRGSLCQKWEAQIVEGCQAGLTAQRIYQDLVSSHGFAGSYQSVKRFVRKTLAAQPLPFRRMESAPGEEAQVDFGTGAWVAQGEGKRKRPHLFRLVLSCSRKAYSEVVERQTTESFIRCLENAFRALGGVPRKVVIDNLKAAVSRAHWHDPELNPKLMAFAAHYGTVILPTRPYMPRHKGKVEAGVKFAQNNALKGRSFESLAEQNQFLLEWEKSVADKRIHGTTRQQVEQVFATVEQRALRPLPAMLFPAFSEAPRSVHLDGHVEVEKRYYSVPPEYVRCKVWVRWDRSLVRIFNQKMEQIALHSRSQEGSFSTDPAHIDRRKRSSIENGAQWLLQRAREIGSHSGAWAQAMLANRGEQGIRVLQGFLQLGTKHLPKDMEAASELAQAHSSWRLRELEALLGRPRAQQNFAFAEKHPLIRDLAQYGDLLPDCFVSHDSDTQTTDIIHQHQEHEPPNPGPDSARTAPVGPEPNSERALAGSGR